ncbi:hypothetical protein Ancab_031143 [Ancistrocladus abbreviatus]
MERIYVAVRARPLSPEDAKSSPWRINDNVIFYNNQSSKFEFDRIFGEECRTKEVYEARTKEIVAAAVRGFNGTVFAYGQTNSGKTHTMRGSSSEPGVIPLAVRDLFDTIHEVADREFLLRMSYMEIYNEEINDLLAPEHRRLQIHESLERGIFVAGLREEIVASPEQVLDLMNFGESHRHIGETNMNTYSSRSHTIFRMIIESRDKTEDDDLGSSCDAVRVSVLNLVDLAGSERAAKTGAEGVRLKEGSHINKSLMTLGTVIKKLSEGAESQGGHVPYRDSKLTRILQPALGGNSNTAIICNITLAQIHVEETKSSLQFASRALHVTNCARVNEILTDAALLKRQKKEIEELRAKLQGSLSEHLEEEILNLRNTLLQTELERERIALELEEEKRAQLEREKRLQEQAKKIKNLSSMVLLSNRDETRDLQKRDKRRDTWCPGNRIRETPREALSVVESNSSPVRRAEREVGPLLSFEELVNDSGPDENICCKLEENQNDSLQEDGLPDPSTLLNVTNRRKGPLKKKSSLVVCDMENNELLKLEADYQDLLQKSETQRIMYDVQIDCLKRKLAEAGLKENDCPLHLLNRVALGDKSTYSRDSDAILVIKQLQQQIKELELEKSSSLQNLDNVVELATEQNICARKKYEEIYEELLDAKEQARAAHEQLTSEENVGKREESNSDAMAQLLLEVQQISDEAQQLRTLIESVSSFAVELLQNYFSTLDLFANFKSSVCQISVQLALQSESIDLQEQIQGLIVNAQNSQKALDAFTEQHEHEKTELFCQIEVLEREVSCLSSSSLSREKESLRKDLEKTKTKLKETEFKLKNAIQEKTRLEGEKANAEREIKKLQSQKTFLERDISRRDSLAGRRRDSVAIDRTSKTFDIKRTRDHEILQEDYKKLEVLAFEMETTIASLENELAAVNREKEEISARSGSLSSELETFSEKLNILSAELRVLQEENLGLRLKLEDSEALHQGSESTLNILVAEKEELTMQLANAVLELEEERAIWSAKERASIEAIKEKADAYNAELMSLSKEISNGRSEMLSLRDKCKVLHESLRHAEENAERETKCSMERSLEIDQLKHELEGANVQKEKSQEVLTSKLNMLTLELNHTFDQVSKLQLELSSLRKERDELQLQVSERVSNVSNDLQICKDQLNAMKRERDKLMTQIEQQQCNVAEAELLRKCYDDKLSNAESEVEELGKRLSDLEDRMHNDKVKYSKDRAKLMMRLRSTQAKLDAFRERYKEAVDEQEFMNKRYEEASTKLKKQLSSRAVEILKLRKQLSGVNHE